MAIKTLSGVDITPAKSNQHEIDTTEDMRAFMGIPEDKESLPTRFIYLDDESESRPVPRVSRSMHGPIRCGPVDQPRDASSTSYTTSHVSLIYRSHRNAQPNNAPQVWPKPTVVLASADNGSQVEPTNGALGWLTPLL